MGPARNILNCNTANVVTTAPTNTGNNEPLAPKNAIVNNTTYGYIHNHSIKRQSQTNVQHDMDGWVYRNDGDGLYHGFGHGINVFHNEIRCGHIGRD